jgi:hypothetical protein
MGYIKKDFIKAFELLLNALEGNKIATYFGEGTKIEIKNIIFSPTKKVCMVDCVVVFGKEIIPTGFDEDNFVRYMIYSVADLMMSEFSVNVMISYDA